MNPLQGIKIIDLSRLLPGPLATHMLAQMGAEVIKVEHPKRIDFARITGPQIDGASQLFHQLNHNKKIISLDYTSAEGRGELLEMIKDADVLLEQFRPGAMEAWGFSYEQVKKLNPKLIYISLTGYGHATSNKMEAGHDFNYLASSGLMSLLKDDNGKPIVPGFQIADIAGGSYVVVMAVQAALIQRANTGKGSFVDVSMRDGVLPLLAVPYSMYSSNLDHRKVNIINGKTTVNYAAYECADGKWISVGALEMKFWNRLCELVGKEEWKRENQLGLLVSVFPKKEVVDLFKTKTRDEWMSKVFKGEDVCVAPILELEEIEKNDIDQGRNNFEEFTTSNGTKLTTFGLPFKISN